MKKIDSKFIRNSSLTAAIYLVLSPSISIDFRHSSMTSNDGAIDSIVEFVIKKAGVDFQEAAKK